MIKDKIFKITISTDYDQWWRYNIALLCGCFDKDGKRVGFVTKESHIATVGDNLESRPEGVECPSEISLTSPQCDNIILYIYIVPHTLPRDRDVSEAQPFEVSAIIDYGDQVLKSEIFNINQWSGASIELKLQGVR